MTKHLSILALVFSLAPGASFAASASFSSIHQQYQSIRAAGMGGAFSAVANDYSAMYYNPAAYARFTEGQMQVALIDVVASASITDFANQLSAAAKAGVSNSANVLSAFYGSEYQLRTKILEMAWARPNWGVSLIPADLTFDLGVHNQGSPSLDVRAYADTTLAFGFGKNIKNETLGLLSWGLTVKGIQREFASKELSAIDLAANPTTLFTPNDTADGFTTDVDLGFLFTPYLNEGKGWDWLRASRPTFSLVGRNLIDSGFSSKVVKLSTTSSTAVPEQLYRVFDIGARFEIPKFLIFGGRFAIDERDILHPLFNAKKGFHAGFEFDWTVTSWWKGQWRVGYGENFPSFGVSALFSFFRLDAAVFSQDIGSYDNPKANQMYQLRLVGEM